MSNVYDVTIYFNSDAQLVIESIRANDLNEAKRIASKKIDDFDVAKVTGKKISERQLMERLEVPSLI